MDRKTDKTETVKIRTGYIKLDQLLKWSGLAGTGTEAKSFILEGLVKVNGDVETRRGKKIYDGDIVEFNDKKIKVESE